MGFSIDLLNNIRNNASQTYQERIPEATQQNVIAVGNALQNYDLLYNEFFPALFNRIGKTMIESKLFKNKLARFKSGTIYTQQDVEEIFIEMSKAEGAYDKNGPNPLGRRQGPDVCVVYHRQNRQDYYAMTVGDLDVLRVFRNEGTLDTFVTNLFNSVYSGAEYDEWQAMKNLLATYEGYCNVQVPSINCATGEGAKAFVKTLRKISKDMSFASDKFNMAGAMQWVDPKNQVLFIHKDVTAEVDVEVLAKAFNLGKTDIQVEIVELDDFGTLENTYALLVDKDFFRVWDTLSKMEPQRNAQGLFTNYFYHVHQILSLSPFKNAVRFTTEEVKEG